jgi:hypothetical protein
MLHRGRGTYWEGRQYFHGVTKLMFSGSVVEPRAVEGKSPVRENYQPPSGVPE